MMALSRRAVRLIAAKRDIRAAINQISELSPCASTEDSAMVLSPLSAILDNLEYLLGQELQYVP